jgi:hypothetical protein
MITGTGFFPAKTQTRKVSETFLFFFPLRLCAFAGDIPTFADFAALDCSW